MPRVPTVSGPGIAEAGIPNAYERSSVSPELLSGPARQEQAMGEAATGLGDQLAKQRNLLVDQANALRVDDALNKASEIALRLQHDKTDGFTALTGYDAVSRPGDLPLADEFTGKLKKQVDDIGDSLSNDQQKRMFAMKANNVVTTFYGHASTYEGQQYREYNRSVRDATVENAKNALTLNYADPDNVDQQVTRIRSAIEGGRDVNGVFVPGSAQMQGKSAAWAREESAKAVSAAHEGAIKSALETGNVNLAMAYFKRYSGDMVAKDVLAVQGTLTRDYDTRQGMTVGNQVFDTVKPKIIGDDMTRLTTLVMGAESKGQRYNAAGGILTSSKGAKGEMQVLDSTNADPGYGVKPAQDNSPDERARVGRDYLGAMVKEYKGDVSKALAAYNAGPGAVDKAIKETEADATTGAFRTPGAAGNWLLKMPAETQKYVAGITAQFAGGAGIPDKPALADLHDQATAMLGPNASPLAIKTAREQVTQRFTDMEKAVAQRKEQVTATAMQQLVQNGGRFAELPASTRANLTQYAPDKVDDVLNYGTRIAKGDDATNPAVYLKLSDPNYLKTVSEAQLYTLRKDLSESDYKHFAGERAKLLNPSGSSGPGDLNSSAVKNTLDARLRELKIDPTPKDDGGNDAARVGSIRRYVDEQLLSMQRDAGKKFTDAETTAAIDKLMSQSAQLKGWFSSYSAPAITAKPGDIPSETRDAIKAAYKKQGIDEPTDAQILSGFLHLNAQRKK